MLLRTLVGVAVLVAGCDLYIGDDDGGDDGGDTNCSLMPGFVAGGGSTGNGLEGIDGVFHVCVIDADDGAPIAGATVQLGDALSAQTDASGLVTFTDDAIVGMQAVTVIASGYIVTSFLDMSGIRVTVPVKRASPPTATAAGTIVGWQDLPPPVDGHYTIAHVRHSLVEDVTALANHMFPTRDVPNPAATCRREGDVTSECAWQLTTRVGAQRLYAVILDGDSNGTSADASDDTFTLLGYAVGPSITLDAGQQVSGVNLDVLADTALVAFSAVVPAAPEGMEDVTVFPILNLGADGLLVFRTPSVVPEAPTTQVPAPIGPLAGSYDAIAVATSASSATPYSMMVARDVGLGGASFGTWLTPPELRSGIGTYCNADCWEFWGPGLVANATFFHQGVPVWSAFRIGMDSLIRLPQLATDPFPSGTIVLDAAVVTPHSLLMSSEFSIPVITDRLGAVTGASISFEK
jgi:hypothetical protein